MSGTYYKPAEIGLAEMPALLEIYHNELSLPMLLARRNRVKDQKGRLEEFESKVAPVKNLMSLEALLEGLDDAIRQRSIGSEDSLIYDLKENKAYLNRKGKLSPIILTLPESAVLKYLMQHPAEDLELRSIADGAGSINGEYIPSHIKNIRQKLGDSYKKPRYIKTVRGIGYKFIGLVATTVKSGSTIYNVSTPQ